MHAAERRAHPGAAPQRAILSLSKDRRPRLNIAVIETYQQPDGSIQVPDALLPYFAGEGVISAR